MRRRLYNALRTVLPQGTRNRLKLRVAHTRRRLAPLYRARHGAFGASELRDDIARHLPGRLEILMVHCSFNALAPMYTGTPTELLDALLELCGPNATLAMPAFYFGGPDGDPASYYRAHGQFDVRRQPSQMGILSELFRRRRGVERSAHPTASVCASGSLARSLVARHHLADTTFGEDTPFGVMAQRRTAIVGIGTEYFRCLSQVHAAEDLLGDRFPLAVRPETVPTELKLPDGTVEPYSLAVADQPIPRRLERLELLLSPDELDQWRFHGVPLFVTSAARVTEVLVEAARSGQTIYDAMPIRRSRTGRSTDGTRRQPGEPDGLTPGG